MSGYSLGTASGRITVDGSMAEKGFEVARSAAQNFFQSINQEAQKVQDFGANLQKASLAGVAGFGMAVKAASGFEARLSAVQAVSGATAEQMNLISDASLRIGADTAFSASEAALAFEELIKAGISVEDALNGAADSTAALAAAGEVSLPRAAEIAANAMNNFNLAGSDMPNVADKIAGAANASAISVDEFASSMSQVGAVASLTGLSFDDTAVAIAEMGNAGIKGSDAGTSLKTVLMNLIPTTKDQVAEFERLGLMAFDSGMAMNALAKNGITPVGSSFEETRQAVSDYLAETQGIPNDTKEMGDAVDKWLMKNGAMNNAFFDTEGNMESLSSVQQTLQDATKDMTKEQQLASLELLFGADAIRGAAVMAKEGASGYEDLASAIGAVTAEDVSSMRMDNLKGDLEELSGSFETLMIKIGQAIMPVVRWLVQGLTGIVNVFNSINDTVIEWAARLGLAGTVAAGVVGTLIQLVAAAGPLLLILLSLKRGFAGFMVIKTAFAGVSTLVGAFGALASVAGTLMRTLFPIIGVVTNLVSKFMRVRAIVMGVAAVFSGPIGIAIGIVAALVALGVLLYNTWEPFKNLIDGIASFFVDTWNNAVNGAKQAWEDFMSGLSGKGPIDGVTGAANTLGLGIRALGEAFKSGDVTSDGFVGGMEQIGIAVRAVWDSLKEAGAYIKDVFLAAWDEVSEAVTGTLLPALQQIGDVFMNDLLPVLVSAGQTVMNALLPALKALWDALVPLVGPVLKFVGVLLGGLLVALFQVALFILGTVLPALIKFAAFIIGGLITVLAKVAVFVITYLITPFANFISFLLGTVIPAIIAFGGAVIDGIVEAFRWVADIVSTVWTAITDFFSGLTGGAKEAGSGAKSGIATFFDSIGQWISDAVAKVGEFMAKVAAVVKAFFQPIIDVWTGIFNFLSPLIYAIRDLIVTVWTGIFGVLQAYLNLIFNLFMWIWTSIVKFIFNIIMQIVNHIVNGFNIAVAWIQSTLTTAWNFIMMVWNAIVAFLTPIIQWIVTTVSTGFNAVVSWIQSTLNTAWNFIVSIWNTIVGFLTPIIQSIVDTVRLGFDTAKNAIQTALNIIWSVISSVWNTIVGFISPIVNRIVSLLTSGFNTAKDAVISAVNTLSSGVRTGIDTAYNFVTGIKDKIVGFFSGAGTWLIDAGANIINGLREGLENAFNGIKDTLNGLTEKIPDWKGPAPLDKILLKPAGKMIMGSLVDGLASEMDKVYDLLNSMNTDIPLSMKAVLSPSIPSLDGSMYVKALPVGADRLPAPVTGEGAVGDVYNTTLNHVPTDHAQETAETILFNQRVKTRGGKYSKVRK